MILHTPKARHQDPPRSFSATSDAWRFGKTLATACYNFGRDVPTPDDQPKQPQPMAETIAMGPITPPVALERYEILSELGRGGMGIVYQARDRETGEVLALKFLKPEIAANTQILDRFKNELRLAHKITHRNVARLY